MQSEYEWKWTHFQIYHPIKMSFSHSEDFFGPPHNILRGDAESIFLLSVLLKSWAKYPSDVNNISQCAGLSLAHAGHVITDTGHWLAEKHLTVCCTPSSSWDSNISLITPISCKPPHDLSDLQNTAQSKFSTHFCVSTLLRISST